MDQPMPGGPQDMLVQFLPIMLLQAVFAVVLYFLTPKLGMKRWVWVILELVPVIGWLAFAYVQLRALFILSDRIAALEPAAKP